MTRALVAVLFATACTSAAPPRSTTPPGPTTGPTTPSPVPLLDAPLGQRVLLVATGYGAEREAITRADATAAYCKGELVVEPATKPVADVVFACAGTAKSLADFLPTAKTNLIVVDLAHATPQLKALAVDGSSAFTSPATYPLVHGGPIAELRTHYTHFVMTGVTAIARSTGAACDTHGIAWLTQNLKPAFAGADIVHISNEVSIADRCEYPTTGTYKFCSKERDFQALLDLKTNLVELTGNHNRDYGDEPFKQTMAWYAKHDITTFGGGNSPEAANAPAILPLAGGKKLGIIGFNEKCPLRECAKQPGEVGANPYDETRARDGIAKLRAAGVDQVWITVQFKEWDSAKPTATQAVITRALIDMGADLVYGSQAHQLQVIEFYKGKPIFHGLGNLLFDQIHRIGVRQAYFLHHFLFEGRLVQSIPVFTFMSDTRQPTLATPAQAAEMKAIAFTDELLYAP